MEALITLPNLLLVIGIVLITLEVVVFGFSTIFLVFIGLACFTSAILMWANVIDESFIHSASSIAVFTFAYALLLWRPLGKLQSEQQDPNNQPNTMKGMQFRLAETVSATQTGVYRYSGIDWKVELAPEVNVTLEAGTAVEVTKAEVGKLLVKPVGS
ncbi:MAG: NfeD family protein [Gammaproteobacteria bacterium]|nr:NfeD family protein [Gammaproteobacteria bacterium]